MLAKMPKENTDCNWVEFYPFLTQMGPNLCPILFELTRSFKETQLTIFENYSTEEKWFLWRGRGVQELHILGVEFNLVFFYSVVEMIPWRLIFSVCVWLPRIYVSMYVYPSMCIYVVLMYLGKEWRRKNNVVFSILWIGKLNINIWN